jgi:cyclopropane-fatty-acyl-phospholipid synthase
LHHEQEVLQLGFDAVFIRKWIYYFCYCEAGFENQYLGDYQIVLTVPRYLSSA